MFPEFKTISKNSLIQSMGRAVSLCVGLFSVGVLTRYLGEEGYGKYIIAFSYFSVFMILADLGLQITMVKELIKNQSRVLGTYLMIKMILAITSFLIASLALLLFPYSNSLKITVLIGTLASTVGVFNNFGFVFLQSQLKIFLSTLIDLSIKILIFGLIIFFTHNNLSLNLIVLATLMGNVLNTILFLIIIKTTTTFKLSFEKKLYLNLLRDSVPIAITIFFTSLFFKIDTLILSIFRSNQEIGLYGFSYKVIENLLMFWGFFMVSTYPIMSKIYNKNKIQFENFWLKILCVSLMFSTGVMIFAFSSSSLINLILGGNNFPESVSLIKILSFSVPFFVVNNLFFHKYVIKKRNNLILLVTFIALSVHIMCCFLFTPKFSFWASSWSIVFSQFLMMCLYYFFDHNRIFKREYR